ncbi:unnamed protein product [Toxocara canis]|uniref:Small hydrophilic protein n=1 Tax=Toxocara canis TaxID=6265 RepID=A0A183U952_TOXCA|nr:unnamed protein product [Toxocara canis]
MQRPQTPEELRNLPRDAKEFGHRGDGFGPMQRPQTPEELRNLPRDAKEFGHPGGGFGPMQRPRTPDELRSVPGDTSRFGRLLPRLLLTGFGFHESYSYRLFSSRAHISASYIPSPSPSYAPGTLYVPVACAASVCAFPPLLRTCRVNWAKPLQFI